MNLTVLKGKIRLCQHRFQVLFDEFAKPFRVLAFKGMTSRKRHHNKETQAFRVTECYASAGWHHKMTSSTLNCGT